MPPIIGYILVWLIVGLGAFLALRGTARPWRRPWVVPVVVGLFAVGGILWTAAGLADGIVTIGGWEIPEFVVLALGTVIVLVAGLLPCFPRLAGEDPKEPMRRVMRHYDRIRELAAADDMAGVRREARAMRRAGNRELAELVRLQQADVDDWLAQHEIPAEASAAREQAMVAEIRAYGARHGIPSADAPAPPPGDAGSSTDGAP